MEYLGKNITQPYISKITIESDNTGGNIVAVTVFMNNEKRSRKMVGTMQTSIIKIADKKTIDKLKLYNNRNMILELIENSKNGGPLGNIELLKAEVKVFSPSVTKKTITQKFYVDENVSDLSFYVVCQYNTNHPYHAKKIFNSPTYKKHIDEMAAIVSEDVIKNRRAVKKANIFKFKNPAVQLPEEQEDHSVSQGGIRIWTGPVHRMSNGEWMPGTKHTPNMPYLTQVSMLNTTLHDYRIFDKISKINFNYRLLENKPLLNKKNAHFSNLYITNDNNGFAKLFFAVDMGELIKNNSKLPQLISSKTTFERSPRLISTKAPSFLALDSSNSSFDEIINLSEIKNITITREKVDKTNNPSTENKSNNDVRQIIAKSTQEGQTVVPSSYSIKKDVLIPNEIDTARTPIGNLSEIKGLYHDSLIDPNSHKKNRYFGATDISMKEIQGGLFKYSVKLDIEDGTMKFIKHLLHDLVKGQHAMALYFRDYKPDTAREDYMINKKGPWVWALDILLKTIKTFADTNDRTALKDLDQQMYIFSAPGSATLESLSKVVNTYNNIVFHIRNLVEDAPSRGKRNKDEMNPKTVISGKRAIPQYISIDHTFSEAFNAKDNGIVGYDYHDINPAATAPSQGGLLLFSGTDFKRRIINDNLRFFHSDVSNKGILINKKYESLDLTKYSYLTPASIKIPGRPPFRTHGRSQGGEVQNSSELAHFNILMDLYSYKTIGYLPVKGQQTLAEIEKSKSNLGAEPGIFSQKLNTFSTMIKNSLIQNMTAINTIVLKKYESSFDEEPSKEENTVAKLMHNSTADKYIGEIQAKDDREDHINKAAENITNPSFIFAPLFYMNNLNIEKEINCLSNMLNININKQKSSKTELKFLPNQLKALAASSENSESTKQTWYDNNESVLKHLKNTAFYYLNQKNIVLIEVLLGFTGGIVASPRWVRLTRDHLDGAYRSPNKKLLCRLSPYINSKICFDKNRILDLNLFNQYFFINVNDTASRVTTRRRTIKSAEGLSSLDNNNLLKINSNFVRTNMIFGETARRPAEMKTRTTQAATTMPTTTTTGGGMGPGEGGSY